jgi:glycopeptide antibiotics resistance protein
LLGTLGFDGGPRRTSYNLIPFKNIVREGLCLFNECRQRPSLAFFVLNLVGNALILSPLGYSLFRLTSERGLSRRGRIFLVLLVGLILSFSIEVLQLLYAGRYSDTSDIVLNGLGALIGAWIASQHERRADPTRDLRP